MRRLCSLCLPACTRCGAAGLGLRGKNIPVCWKAGVLGVWCLQGCPQREGPSTQGCDGACIQGISAWRAGPVVSPSCMAELAFIPWLLSSHHGLYLSDPKGLVSHASSIQPCAQTSITLHERGIVRLRFPVLCTRMGGQLSGNAAYVLRLTF